MTCQNSKRSKLCIYSRSVVNDIRRESTPGLWQGIVEFGVSAWHFLCSVVCVHNETD